MKKSIVLFLVSIENLKILQYRTFSKKTLVLSVICSKCENEDGKFFKEKSIEISKIYNQFKNMVEENTTQEFRLTNIDKTRNIFVEEKEQNEL